MFTAEILSQGDEVVTGQIADTNAAWLSERLTDLGFVVTRHTAVGDDEAAIAAAIVEIGARADVCIGTGGLGPTTDDLTSEAAARAFGRPCVFHPDAMRSIEEMFAKLKREMPEANRKQAWLPGGSTVLDNEWGTAPGFAVKGPRAWFAFLPGVPREMKAMFSARVEPLLRQQLLLSPGRLVTFRTTGIGESHLQQLLGAFDVPGVTVGYRTSSPENLLKLRFPASMDDRRITAIVDDVAVRLGPSVFTIDGAPPPTGPGLGLPAAREKAGGYPEPGAELAAIVGWSLGCRGETLAVAESCTGGRVAAMCTAIPGSSSWFLEGVVTYANAAKIRLLGVDADAIALHGAVSAEVAEQMAAGCRQRSGATYALAITGIAGPKGGSADKPVGTVYIALAQPGNVHHRSLALGGDRYRIQLLSAAAALDLLRRTLQDLPCP